ncbi:uncharacterized protein C11orf52 homolog [Discoglossus pictus]
MGNSKSSLRSLSCFVKGDQQKGSKKKKQKGTNPPPPMYDTVTPDFPVYAVVDKTNRKKTLKVDENVQYAEIEIVRRPPSKSHKKVVSPPESTEYATIKPQVYNSSNGTLV